MSEKLYALKCTHCAAPLNVLGGGRVRTLTCEYCHSVLDLNDNYAILSKFNDVKRPLGPFEIGMRGNIKGVEWTIIGWITYKTTEFPSEEWSEFFLYSAKHGYAWLVYEDGVISFSMRVRDFDLFQWQTNKPKTVFYHKGHYLRNESAYQFYVDYVEGELNWVAKFGDKFLCWDYSGVRHQTLSIEKSDEELEVYHTEKLKRSDIYNAFSLEYIEETRTTKKVGPSDIVIDPDDEATDTNKGFMILFVIMVLFSLSSLFYSKTILTKTYSSNFETTFTIDSSAFLTAIKLSVTGTGDAGNKLWLYKDGKKIFYIDRNKIFFIKQDLGKSWKYNAASATIYLKLDKGTYKLICHKNANSTYTHITIEQEVIRIKYILPLLVILALLFLASYAHLFNTKFTMILFVLIGILIAYQIFGYEALFGLGLFVFFIYNSYKEYYQDDEDDR